MKRRIARKIMKRHLGAMRPMTRVTTWRKAMSKLTDDEQHEWFLKFIKDITDEKGTRIWRIVTGEHPD